MFTTLAGFLCQVRRLNKRDRGGAGGGHDISICARKL